MVLGQSSTRTNTPEADKWQAWDVAPAQDERVGIATPISKNFPVLNALPTIKSANPLLNGKLDPAFWRYYLPPFRNGFFYNPADPYNDIVQCVWGPRGGGKTLTDAMLSIVDGMMKGIAVISNVPIAWIARDNLGKRYRIESIPFDVELFVSGDQLLYRKRLLIDEGNYLADRMRANSNKNMAVTDILQQARKLKMCVTFSTINYAWIDARITGSLCDVLIECHDLYYTAWGQKAHVKKGQRISWDLIDQSGKLTNHANTVLDHRNINSWMFWGTFDTLNFVDPRESRKRLKGPDKMITDEDGKEVKESEWFAKMEHQINQIIESGVNDIWGKDLYNTLRIDDNGLRRKLGHFLKGTMGIGHTREAEDNIYHLS